MPSNNTYQKSYEGPNITAVVDIILFNVINSGTIKKTKVILDSASGVGDSVFNVKKNGVQQFVAELTVLQGQLSIEVTQDIVVVEGDKLVLESIAPIPADELTAPITIEYEVDEGPTVSLDIFSDNHVTASLADDAAEVFELALGKSYAVSKITTDVAAWIQLYRSSAARLADASRLIDDDPTGEHELVVEILTEVGNLIYHLSPMTIGITSENPRSSNCYLRATNKSGGPITVDITIEVVQLED